MRMFWTLFFLGSMLIVGADVMERRDPTARLASPSHPVAGDPMGYPTPKPDL